MKQQILVFGAGGFIGANVMAALAATDWAAPLAARPDSMTLNGVSGLVNCISDSPASISAGAAKIFHAAAASASVRIVHISSMTVYGATSGLIDESAPLRSDLGAYAAAQVAAEGLAAAYPKCIILRPGCEYGAQGEQWSGRIGDLLMSRRLGDLGAGGDGYCNLVHVRDVAAAVIRTLERPALDGRVFNLSGPKPLTWNEYLIRYAALLGAVPVRRISQRRLKIEAKLQAPVLKVLQILARAGGLGARGLRAPIPPSLVRVMAQEIQLDGRSAETALGLAWTDTDVGLKESAQWYRESRASH